MHAHLSCRSNAGELWYELIKKWRQATSSTLCRVPGGAGCGCFLIKGRDSLLALFHIHGVSLCQRFWVWWLMAHLTQHEGIVSDSILLVVVLDTKPSLHTCQSRENSTLTICQNNLKFHLMTCWTWHKVIDQQSTNFSGISFQHHAGADFSITLFSCAFVLVK